MSGEARSALHASYEALGASFATMRGRLVPERFGEVEDECQAVRTAAGVVDRSDLGYLTASGGSCLSPSVTSGCIKGRHDGDFTAS